MRPTGSRRQRIKYDPQGDHARMKDPAKKKNLPESIFVRVYEKRIDLLRAAIIGAAGKSYHDGLFFSTCLPSKNSSCSLTIFRASDQPELVSKREGLFEFN